MARIMTLSQLSPQNTNLSRISNQKLISDLIHSGIFNTDLYSTSYQVLSLVVKGALMTSATSMSLNLNVDNNPGTRIDMEGGGGSTVSVSLTAFS